MYLKRSTTFMVLFFLISLVFFTGCNKLFDQKVKIDTEYKAIFLNNGQVFFGQLEEIGDSFAVLKDVFYVQSQVVQEGDKKGVKNILIKRGNEWHAPDIMFINRQQILVIEPVRPKSQVDQLIKEANAQKPKS